MTAPGAGQDEALDASTVLGRAAEPSPGARRMWLLEQLAPGPGLHVQTSLRISGPLRSIHVRHALDDLAQRHRALRTRLPSTDGRVRAVVDAEVEIPLVEVDLASATDERDPEAELDQLAVAEARRPFDLVDGPLTRAVLARLGPEEHHLLLLSHHAIVDRWAATHLATDLIDLLGSAATPGPPASTMASPAPTERDGHDGPDGHIAPSAENSPKRTEEVAAHWRRRLAGAPASLDLPTDRPRPARRRHRGSAARAVVDPASFEALSALAEACSTTRFTAVLAAWAVVVQRFTGTDDLVIGTHLSGRGRTPPPPPVSCAMNTVPLRLDLSGDPSLRTLLTRTRATVDDALAHADLPFDVLVEQVGARRDPGRDPVFQVDYAYWGTPEPHGSAGPLSIRSVPLDLGAALLEVGLAATPTDGGGLELRVDVDADLFDPATGQSLVRQVRNVLLAGLADPDRPARHLSTLDERDCRILTAWSTGPRLPTPARPVTDLIAERAATAPDALAVRSTRGTVSYADLDQRVAAIAGALHRRGVGPGQVVGVTAQHPDDWLVADLGVLRAGAAFAPLDPSLPPHRRQAVTELAGVALVIGAEVGPDPWGEAASVELADLEREGHQRRGRSRSGPAAAGRAGPEDPAYVIFTSGSTGAPKAVLVTVANLAASTAAHLARYPQAMGAVICVHEPVFDAWIGTAFWTLCGGGAVTIAAETERRDPRHIGALVQETGATHLVCLPTYWRLALEHGAAGQLSSLAVVVVGSEACPPGLARRHHAVLGATTELHNEYGPTETTVWCAAHRLGPDEDRSPVPIGRPVAGVSLHVTDETMALVAPQMPGELLVGGSGVAAGYLGEPPEQGSGFVEDPFAPGCRAYRTGDRARWLADGTLQFLGRQDRQLKLRGRRLELGDVEAALTTHPLVHEAVAAVVDGPASPILVGWVTGASAGDVDQVVTVARDRLASWMVPTHVEAIERLPLTTTGKVDRQALVDRWTPPTRPLAHARPSTATERHLAELWRELLGLDDIGIDEDFFDLGGHSMLAVELFVRIEDRFGQDLPLSTLIEHPTIAGLGAQLDDGPAPRWPTSVELGSHDPTVASPFFCVHGAGGNVLRLRDLAAHLGQSRAFHAIAARGLDGHRFPFDRIEDMAEEYLGTIREQQPSGPYLLGGFSIGGVIAFEMARQLRAGGERAALVVLIDSALPGPDRRADPAASPDPDRGITRTRAARLRRLAGIAVDEARLGVGLRIPITRRSGYLLRTSRRLLRGYTVDAPYDGRVLLVRPSDDPPAEASWRRLAPDLEAVTVTATHHEGLLDEPNAARVATVIESAIEEAMAPWR